ncbi:MAG: TolB-like protein/DNA-binding SARP family transcriptional activator [Candidatus Azotimanducaceae bacterium]|jgi:TolB-like protein/DNA-binding SARP family transcriptional activator
MQKIKFELLGNPKLSIPGENEVHLSTKKSLALLVYLACPPGISHSREQIAALLWSRSAEEQARSSLRQELVRVRKALGVAKHVFCSNFAQISIKPENISIDTIEFEELIAKGDVESLEDSVEMIRGEFVAGLVLNEKPFEEWLGTERSRISELAIVGMSMLLKHYEALGEHGKAGVVAQKLLLFDPYQESVHRALMRSLSSQGRLESALQQFKLCEDLLRAELSIEPSPETSRVRDEIIQSRESKRHAPTAPRVESDNLIRSLGYFETDAPQGSTRLPLQLRGLNLIVPERPSIVILPFKNLTSDAENDYLADGIRIDIQAALVKITGIFLIAAGSANALKMIDPREAANTLGVRYTLSGSLRRSGDDLRISSELIDAQTGCAVWTETYDRKLENGFAVQDEIIEQIVTKLDVKLLGGEQAAVWHRTLRERNALESFYKGLHEFFKIQKDANLRARQYFEDVDKKQPDVAIGATWTALCHWFDVFKGWGSDPKTSLKLAGSYAEKAVNMVDADGQAHMVLSHVHLMNRRFDDALIVGRKAIALRPNCTNANGFFANVLHYCGEQSDAIDHITWAIRYSPVYPPFFADILSLSYLLSDGYEEALAISNESLSVNAEGLMAKLVKAAAYSAQADIENAQLVGNLIVKTDPTFSIQEFEARQLYRNPDDLKQLICWLRQAGL